MCTVSLIRPLVPASREWTCGDPLLLRLVVNRDELRARPPALPPVAVGMSEGRALMPVDPQGGGTWVAATDAGLVFALLNGPVSEFESGTGSAPSRGIIIPRLLDSRSVDEALQRVLAMDVSGFRPWRLLVADASRFADIEMRPGGRVRYLKNLLPVRLMATSSSVRPADATRRRADLFREVVSPVDEHTQDAFHAHRFQDDPGLGVFMDRPEARTVSRTTIEVGGGRIVMRYQPMTPTSLNVVPITMTLARPPLRRGAA